MMKLIKVLEYFIILIGCFLMVSCNKKSVDSPTDEVQVTIPITAVGTTHDTHDITPTTEAIDNQVNLTATPNADNVTPVAEPTQILDNHNDSSNADSNNSESAFDLEAFKKILINAVNDDMWYLTDTHSAFSSFAMQTFDMDIYTKADEPTSIWLILNNPQEKAPYPYFALEFKSDKRGFLNEYDMCFTVSTHQEAEDYIKNEGFTFYMKTDIFFGEATKPVYTETTDAKQEVVDNILNAITEYLKLNKFEEGTYKIYIGNFRDNSKFTSAVIEDSEGKQWLASIVIYDDGITSVDRMSDPDNDLIDVIKKWSELVKDNSVSVKDITLLSK